MQCSASPMWALCAVLALGCDDNQLWRRWTDFEPAELAHEQSDAGVASTPRCDPDNGGIRVADGHCALVFADHLGKARQLVVTPRGDVYVAVADAPNGLPGGIVALRDGDGDGRADQIERFGSVGGSGLALRRGALYFAPDDAVLRYKLDDDALTPSVEPVTVVRGLPSTPDHYAKALALRGNELFVSIGSSSNACQRENRMPRSPGIDPCPELGARAGVWMFHSDKLEQRQRDGERYVEGARHLAALALNPRDGQLYAAQSGRELLFESWPELYTPADDALAPAEELVRLRRGGNLGWPYCYYEPRLARRVLAPEYGGDGLQEGYCGAYDLPISSLPAHWAPLGMAFSNQRDGAYIASHGSRSASGARGPGYNVVFQRFRRGEPFGEYEEFASGFAGDGPLPEAARYRPAGVAEGADGSVYISDDKVGRIWRVLPR
jgi:glucose/arabinose dehydrogenase